MRTRLLAILLSLMAGVLLALGFPLAASLAAAQQQKVVVDRMDDAARFAAVAQFVTARTAEAAPPGLDEEGKRATLASELRRYEELYRIRAGVFHRDRAPMAVAPAGWRLPGDEETDRAFEEALDGRRSHDPPQAWPWRDRRLVVASPIVRDGDVVAVVLTDSPTDGLRSRILHDWLVLGAGEAAAMLVAVLAAVRLTGWVLRPVRLLDAVTHDIATGRLKSRVAPAGGPPELRRLAGSFNEMADHLQDVLEQQRAFVADASHQLRNPLAALMLRIEVLGYSLPGEHRAELASVKEEGRRLARVLDDLLGLALAEHAEPDLKITDIAELAAERVAAWQAAAGRQEVALAYDGPGAATGWADPIALSSALDAVVDNAIKFTPAGEGVEVRVRVLTGTVEVTVADGGPGLAEEELSRIGDRFWRSGRHQNVDGSGLGLSIARALLTAGGGGIAYAPRDPHGLEVTLSVPRSAPVV
ncbi:sensor histidine kinase [Streptomyces sp. HB2AG]|uniref:sensor histidine kinase n=1 Tax=Streptomyces sp. HB2AG TaxID=2983400 RepID=UPI0022AA96F6|nr:HAMP domain-containing sensor histidine kinase [Streptomyces sp. HB2AG]MCZ2526966.1 HAMP domain-containing sensor histidine kinase [Streptomyces sp. HB2AG]